MNKTIFAALSAVSFRFFNMVTNQATTLCADGAPRSKRAKRKGWVFASVLATAITATALVARADTCGDNRHSCNDPASPECWFNPSRSEYACSPRGWNHCGARSRSYSCQPPSNCLGDGSAPPYCSSRSSLINPLRLPGVTPASFHYVEASQTLPAPPEQRAYTRLAKRRGKTAGHSQQKSPETQTMTPK
jgi:hypothetical protein